MTDIQGPVELQLLHRRGASAGPVPSWVAEALGPGGTPITHEKVLTWLLREELHLRCGCGRVLHVVRGTTLYLRRNPRQPLVGNGRSCSLCESDGSASASLQAFRQARRDGIGPVMRIPVRAADEASPKREGGSKKGSGARYAGTFAVLWQIMERAGFLEIPGRIGIREVWDRMYRVLDVIPHSGSSSAALSRFSWMPGPRYSGGLRDLNARVCADWRHRYLKPEAWIFGAVRQLPKPGDSRMPVQVELAVSDYVYKLTVAPHALARVGTVGPFLAFAVGSPVPVATYAVPKIHRVVFQMIVDEGIRSRSRAHSNGRPCVCSRIAGSRSINRCSRTGTASVLTYFCRTTGL